MASRRRLAIDGVLNTLEKNGGMAFVEAPDARRLGMLFKEFGFSEKIIIANSRRRRKSLIIRVDVMLPKIELPEL